MVELGGSAASVTCPLCSIVTCVSHRAPSDHMCEADAAARAKAVKTATKHQTTMQAAVDRAEARAAASRPSGTDSKMSEKRKRRKQQAALLRLKMSAKGDAKIPAANRFYLAALFAADDGALRTEKASALFFRRDMTIGHILDALAAHFGETRLNNQGGSQAPLRLLGADTGVELPTSAKLERLDSLTDGSGVVLTRFSEHPTSAQLAAYGAALLQPSV